MHQGDSGLIKEIKHAFQQEHKHHDRKFYVKRGTNHILKEASGGVILYGGRMV